MLESWISSPPKGFQGKFQEQDMGFTKELREIIK